MPQNNLLNLRSTSGAINLFKSWDSSAVWTQLLLDKAYLGPDLFAWRYTGKRCGLDWSFCRCFCSMTLWRRYDVRKFDADTILFREILCKKRDILIFKQRFQSALGWNHVKYARITITHVCFIALTLVRSLRQGLNTRPIGLMFKQLPWDPANVNAWKYSKQQRCSLAPRLFFFFHFMLNSTETEISTAHKN